MCYGFVYVHLEAGFERLETFEANDSVANDCEYNMTVVVILVIVI